jgi:hypothetical protein
LQIPEIAEENEEETSETDVYLELYANLLDGSKDIVESKFA